jgi:phosphatidylglycerophosphatase A
MTTSQARAEARIAPLRLAWRQPHLWIALGFGSGLARGAPGTAGTLAAMVLYPLLQPLPLGWYLVLLLVCGLVGIWACGKTEQALGIRDPSAVVWDEFVGYWMTMVAAPSGWRWMLAGFLVFRFFDILKPWPIRELDLRVQGGMGIMLDDCVAGLCAWVVMQGLRLALG